MSKKINEKEQVIFKYLLRLFNASFNLVDDNKNVFVEAAMRSMIYASLESPLEANQVKQTLLKAFEIVFDECVKEANEKRQEKDNEQS